VALLLLRVGALVLSEAELVNEVVVLLLVTVEFVDEVRKKKRNVVEGAAEVNRIGWECDSVRTRAA